MNQPFMTFNQELAEKSGTGGGLQEGGAYVCTIESAIYKKANSGAHGVEFTVKTDDGLTGRYINSYFAKSDNAPIASGQSLLNALMGFCGAQGLSWVNKTVNNESVSACPELQGKKVGLFLQKRLYTKNDGSDAYGFEIRCPFDPMTKQTFKEKSQNQPAKSIDLMTASYKDKDDRSAPTIAQQQSAPQKGQQGGYGNQDFSDDIPFG